ncbi:hypothetical protein [Armatimonas sp.]|uniref:hypothetical protein n=1 Tax=Armatimonas sp. TaxID=1872638 RepID=UPI00286A7ED8|nr:hypothetical protein [Armatimonas sp.]
MKRNLSTSKKLKLKYVNGIYFTEIKIKNKIYKMIVDTGSHFVFFSEDAARQINEPLRNLDNANATAKEYYKENNLIAYAEAPECYIGDVNIRLGFFVHRGDLFKDIKCDGVLGFNFIMNFITVLNFKEKYLELFYPENKRKVSLKEIVNICKFKTNFVKVPVGFTEDFLSLTIDCHANNIGLLKLKFDTGGARTILNKRPTPVNDIKSPGTNISGKDNVSYEVKNLYGSFKYTTALLDFKIKNMKSEKREIASFYEGDENNSNPLPHDGVLGLDVLDGKIIIINYADKELHISE